MPIKKGERKFPLKKLTKTSKKLRKFCKHYANTFTKACFWLTFAKKLIRLNFSFLWIVNFSICGFWAFPFVDFELYHLWILNFSICGIWNFQLSTESQKFRRPGAMRASILSNSRFSTELEIFKFRSNPQKFLPRSPHQLI